MNRLIDDQLLAGVLHPVLQLDQLDLEQPLGDLVLVPRHALVVRVVLPPGVDHPAVGPDQDRVVIVVVLDPQAREQGQVVGVAGPGVGQTIRQRIRLGIRLGERLGHGVTGHGHSSSHRRLLIEGPEPLIHLLIAWPSSG
jgi:hypothetical protein